ncbi:Solute carrier family 22 member 2 [Fasciola hepatica]|uniref:Solute carrier family 22 member 2 n=1 Tax=Fasciola hepatica TaxID=6192 RepID=A0A2H1CRB6_FASHE|nr:Solute carrier family 22 member 2 [Fasciola hepatica]
MACDAITTDRYASEPVPPDDSHEINVDNLLENLVKPCGLTQWSLALLLMFSTSTLATFPIYGNSASPHRCRMEPEVEQFVDQHNVTFNHFASRIGPWYGQNRSVHPVEFGCLRYKRNWTQLDLSKLFLSNQSDLEWDAEEPTEPCPKGYVHQPSDYHYPQSVVVEFSTVCDYSWLTPFGTSIYMVGMLFGFIVGGWSGDHFGRRPTIMVASFVELVTGIWTVLSPNYTNYVLARGFMGVGNTAKISVASVLNIEMTVARYRSIFHAILALGLNFLYRSTMALFAYLIPNWRWMYVATMSPNFLSVFYFVFLPESPRWLLSRGRRPEALRVLYRACRINHWWRITPEVKQMRALLTEELELQKLNKPMMTASGNVVITPRKRLNLIKPFTSPKMARCTLLCVCGMLGLVMGFFGLLLYARNLSTYVYLVGFVNALTAIPANILSALLYRFCRRRKRPLMGLICLAAIILASSSAYTLIMRPANDLVMTVSSNLALILVSASVCMCYVYVPELFPSEIRTHAFGLVLGLARVGSIVCTFINELDRFVAHSVPMLIYAVVFVCVLVALALLEDTSGENLPDVSHENP